ncbi:MAG TPA: hypothetical protein VKJ45_16440 [Blastocatellia bacterium]|nr:hypothetical protein [Blastocatellia bacterium]
MPDAPSPDELAAKASFIFRGTVLRVNASTLREVSDKSNTAIVRVDETVQAPKVLSHYTGQEITVYLPDLAEVKAGDQAVFFTNSWLFGNDGVAVRSLGHHPPAAANAALGMSGADPVANLQARDTRAHYDSADAVVSGTVVSVRVPPASAERRAVGEHDPQWREATIEVDQRHKGAAGKREIIVRFPASHDRMWHRAPKLRAGDKGHFLLHAPSKGADYYTLLHPEDFELGSRQGPVHRLLNQQGAR